MSETGENKVGYYAVIPASVRYDDTIPANAKLLYGEISALIGADGYCYASNQYFADLYGVACETIARLLTKLEKADHIRRVIERDENGQITIRKLFLKVSMPDGWGIDEKINTPRQKSQEGIDEKVKETNTSNIKKEKDKKEKPEPLTDSQLHALGVSCINELAQPSWTAATKNDLYRWVMALYDPNRVVRKAHPVRSELGVKGTFRKLAMSGNNPTVMIGMLCTAIEGGWQGVQVPAKSATVQAQQPQQREREYPCL